MLSTEASAGSISEGGRSAKSRVSGVSAGVSAGVSQRGRAKGGPNGGGKSKGGEQRELGKCMKRGCDAAQGDGGGTAHDPWDSAPGLASPSRNGLPASDNASGGTAGPVWGCPTCSL